MSTNKSIISVVGLVVALVPFAVQAQSALYLEPATAIYPIGDPFTVDVRIDTGGSTIGTADATIVYDQNDLTFVSVSDDGSVMSRLLVDSGTTPGRIDISAFIERNATAFTGTDGLIARVTFTPRRNAATEVRFSQGAATPPLRLNASVGDLANIISNLRSATYTLVPRESIPPARVAGVATDATGSFPITPLPVPDGEWFGTTSVRLSWTLPEGVDAMRTVVTGAKDEETETMYEIPVSSVMLTDLSEGRQYFVVQFQSGGVWGEATRFPLNVDTSPPETIVVREADRTQVTDPVAFVVESYDTHSGVARYEVSVDGDETVPWDGKGTFTPEVSGPGEHVLTVTAFDVVGNDRSEDVVFMVRSLDAPVPTRVPDRVLTGESVVVEGTTYPDSSVTAFVSLNDADPEEIKVRSDYSGVFDVQVTNGARPGTYTLWFQVEGDDGAISPLSIKRSFLVSQPFIMLWGGVAVTYLSVIVPLLALIVLLGLILWLTYMYVQSQRRRVRRETTEAYEAVNEEFSHLRDDLRKQIGMLEKANQSRELTREEMKIFRELSKRLDYIERHIEQEIEDIADIDTEDRGTTVLAPRERVRPTPAEEGSPATPPTHTIRIDRK